MGFQLNEIVMGRCYLCRDPVYIYNPWVSSTMYPHGDLQRRAKDRHSTQVHGVPAVGVEHYAESITYDPHEELA